MDRLRLLRPVVVVVLGFGVLLVLFGLLLLVAAGRVGDAEEALAGFAGLVGLLVAIVGVWHLITGRLLSKRRGRGWGVLLAVIGLCVAALLLIAALSSQEPWPPATLGAVLLAVGYAFVLVALLRSGPVFDP